MGLPPPVFGGQPIVYQTWQSIMILEFDNSLLLREWLQKTTQCWLKRSNCINCKLSYFNLRVPILSHPCSNTIWCTSGSQQIWHRRGWRCPRTWTCSTGSCMLGPHSSWTVGWWGDHLSMPELKNNEFVCEIDN